MVSEVSVSIEHLKNKSPLAGMSETEFEEFRNDLLEYGGGCGPSVIDLEITGACPWRCEWCWGPEHTSKDQLSELEWIRIVEIFATLGTERFTITGGEPLLSKNLQKIVEQIIANRLAVTLSTSGSGLVANTELLELLSSVDSSVIGLPLDGFNKEANSAMRPALNPVNEGRNFDDVVESIRLLQMEYPNIGITLRTVASSQNRDEIGEIPQTLIDLGIDTALIRWKIYQLNANDGPRTDQARDYEISDQDFMNIFSATEKRWAGKFKAIEPQTVEESAGRYIFVKPDGEISVPDDVLERMQLMESEKPLNLSTNPTKTAEWLTFLVAGLELPKLLAFDSGHAAVDVLLDDVLGPEESLDPR